MIEMKWLNENHSQILAIAIIGLVLLSVFVLGTRKFGTIISRYQPPSSGDWIISTSTVVENEYLIINGSINIEYNKNLEIINSTLVINGGLTGQGKNGFKLVNSKIYLNGSEPNGFIVKAHKKTIHIENSKILNKTSVYNYFIFKYGNITLKNVELRGFGHPDHHPNMFYINRQNYPNNYVYLENVYIHQVSKYIKFQQINRATVNNLTMSELTENTMPLYLNDVNNAVFNNTKYVIDVHYSKPDVVGLNIENSANLTFVNLNFTGFPDVNTPHFHLSLSGVTESTNITVKDSYFYGGGNGAISGDVVWRNCTFDNCVDGTEIRKYKETFIYDSTFKNIHDSEINLQGGVKFNFVRCNFQSSITVNLSNGTAICTDCTFKDLVIDELGDQRGGKKYAGTLYLSWNLSNFTVRIRINWQETDLIYSVQTHE